MKRRHPIRPVIVVEASSSKVSKNQMLRISARLYDRNTLQPFKVSRIYMTIISSKDGHVVWPLEVVRKDASGFDIGIGTEELKSGEEYLVRVSNNWNLSPSAATTFTVKKSKSIPLGILVPLTLSAYFVNKYSQEQIQNIDELTEYLKNKGYSDEYIQKEIEKIIKDTNLEEDLKIPVDTYREIEKKIFRTQMDHKVCRPPKDPNCKEHEDEEFDYDDPAAPLIPIHKNCRCTYDLIYAKSRDDEFRNAARIAMLARNIEEPLMVIKKIKRNSTYLWR